MTRTLPLVLVLAAGWQAAPPNIVFVLFDDMGWGQPQSYNSQSALRTPHLDKLAAQGMRFTDAHSASAVCTPTRYGVLTGRYPGRIGQSGVLATWSPPLIPPSRLTVASLLKQHGYVTACFGKWHLGMNWQTHDSARKQMDVGDRMTDGPNALGFDYFCGYTHAANIQSVIEQDRCVAQIQPSESQPLLIQKAVEWIDNCAKKGVPFFLYFAMCPPHTPVVPAPAFVGKSDAKDLVLNNLCLSSGDRTALRRPNPASEPFPAMARVGQGYTGTGGPAIFARLRGGGYRAAFEAGIGTVCT